MKAFGLTNEEIKKLKGKDVILHEEMSIDERNAELERLKKESEALTEWEED